MKRRFSLAWVAGLAISGLLTGCGHKAEPEAAATTTSVADEFVNVRVAEAKEVVADDTLAATGSIFAGTDVNVAAKISGRVMSIGADDGQRVLQGQVMVRLDDRAARADLKRAEAGVYSARAALAKAKLSRPLVTVQSESAARTAQAGLDAARARLAQALESEKIAKTKSGSAGVDIAQAEAASAQAVARLAQARETLKITGTQVDSDAEQAAASLAQAQSAQRSAEAALAQAQTSQKLSDTSTKTTLENARQGVIAAQNNLQILQTGARAQERVQAESQVTSAKAAQQTAQIEFDRAKFLYERGAVSKAQFDNAKLALETRNEALRQAQQGLSLVQEGPRVEEVKIAQTQLAQAEQQLALATDSRERESSLRQQDVNRATQAVDRAKETVKQAGAQLRTAQAARGQRSIREQDVAQAEQAVATAEQALKLARAGVGQAEIAAQEVAAARTQVTSAQEQLKQATSNLVQPQMTSEDIKSLEGSLRSAQAIVQQAQVYLGDHTLYAPLAGGVAKKTVEAGEVINPGQTLFRLVSDRYVHFEALVPEEKVRFVTLGSEVDVRVDAVPGEAFTGKVLEILPAADLRSRTFTVKIGVENSAHRLREGMFARGLIVIQRNQHTLQVPSEAVVRRDDKTYLVVVGAGDEATPVEVEVGTARGGLVTILSGEVKPGDRVAVDGAEQVSQPGKVRVLNE